MSASQRWISGLGRVLLSLIFIVSGIGKLADPAGTMAAIESVGAPWPQVAYVIAVFVEVALGFALLLGFKAKWAAAGIALFTLATALMFHSDMADQVQRIMFLKNVTIAGGLLIIVAFGPGGYSLDQPQPGANLQDAG